MKCHYIRQILLSIHHQAYMCVIYEGWHILFTCGKHFPDPIMSTTEETWTYNTCQTAPLFIEVHVPSLEIERSCICVLGI